MQIQTHLLIEDLLNRTEKATRAVKRFKELSIEQLNYKKSATEWSVLECIEHLNLYGDFYLVEIEKQILAHKSKAPSTVFKSGLLGNYFANLMQVKDGKVNKMKSPKDKNPVNSVLTPTTLDRFLKQQERLKSLLIQAQHVDLTKTKTAISLTGLVQLRLGDTFRFFVYHIERHVLQAERIHAGRTSPHLSTSTVG
ncbi:DinB family protein [Chitinophagaceae bacterium LB-8]|uniref:DinB family protein n=1 Tax=Paraflavisolibacter caeni TaxID=2982496 RepID=A0A9X2XX40_9BACT|nr:DinB family protein [Paraflavisolibacter caeni]MCU7550901.1 DinB family protein [Paraflavisolibacter caeni]